MTTTDPFGVGLSRGLYGLMLRAYPRGFRQDYREETLRVFRDDCRVSYRAGGWWALFRLWLHALPDVIGCALAEHLSDWMAEHPGQQRSARHQVALVIGLALGVVAVFLVDTNTPPETPMAAMYACVLFAAGALLPPRLAALIGAATLGVYVVDGWVSPSGWTLYRALGLVIMLVAGLWALRTGADHARLRARAAAATPGDTARWPRSRPDGTAAPL